MLTATLTDEGQMTFPKVLRNALQFKTGGKIRFVFHGDEAVLNPVSRSVNDVTGMLHRPGQAPVSIDKMNNAIRKRANGFVQ